MKRSFSQSYLIFEIFIYFILQGQAHEFRFWTFGFYYITSGMAITVEPLDFENNCVEGRQARDNNYVEIERDTREE